MIELMTTVVVMSVLLTLAAPSYRALVLDSRMTAQANEFLTALSLTRSEAVKRNATVTLSAKAGGWSNGWEITAGGPALREHPALEGASTLSNAANPSSISFRSNGQPLTGATTFNLCNPNISIAPGRDIEVGLSGRARTNKPGTC